MKERTKKILENFFARHNELIGLKKPILDAMHSIIQMRESNKILVCGNGGSSADSEHISGELLKSFVLKRHISDDLKEKLVQMYGEDGKFISDNLQGGIKCIPLPSLTAGLTAYLNDCEPSLAYAQLVNSLGIKGDILIAISTSGNSKNIVYASKVAKALGMTVISLTGETGGELKKYSDILINVPCMETYLIQEYHLPIYHLICLCVESEIFGE